MRTGTGNEWDAVELVMALEEELEGEIPRRHPALSPFLVPMKEAKCQEGGLVADVAVFARSGTTVLFASLESPQFGTGEAAATGEVRSAMFYPTLELAARSFLGRKQTHDI